MRLPILPCLVLLGDGFFLGEVAGFRSAAAPTTKRLSAATASAGAASASDQAEKDASRSHPGRGGSVAKSASGRADEKTVEASVIQEKSKRSRRRSVEVAVHDSNTLGRSSPLARRRIKKLIQNRIDVVDMNALQPAGGAASASSSGLLKKARMVLENTETADTAQMSMWELAKHHPYLLAQKVSREYLSPHEDFVLFRSGDMPHWIVFTLAFIVVLVVDNLCFFREHQVLSLGQASLYVLAYLALAGAFVVYVYFFKGADAAALWFSGYLLEWMLSVDNLFVFSMVFDMYACPDKLKHKPLFYGIMGAIVFRMFFFVVGEALVHTLHFMHLIFGSFLVYTGVVVVLEDDEDNNPTEHPIVVWAAKVLPLVNGYDEKGSFFVKVQKEPDGTIIFPPESDTVKLPSNANSAAPGSGGPGSSDAPSSPKGAENLKVYEAAWAKSPRSLPAGHTTEWRCTFLFIVVICLEITDLMFAVDSVSAIVAQVPDLYLAYTACVMAMLGLRATFLVIDEFMRLFDYLKYGVALLLVFIGIKLILSKVVVIPPLVVCAVFTSTLAMCVSVSVCAKRERSGNSPATSPNTPTKAGTPRTPRSLAA